MLGRSIPDVTLKTRVRDESIGGPNPFRWQDLAVREEFAGKKVVIFSLPGAFTPTCSNEQCPNYERLYDVFKAAGRAAGRGVGGGRGRGLGLGAASGQRGGNEQGLEQGDELGHQSLRVSNRWVKTNTSLLHTSMQRPQLVQSAVAITGSAPALPLSGTGMMCGSGHTA